MEENSKIELIDLSGIVLPVDLINKITPELLRQYQFIPVSIKDNVITCVFGEIPSSKMISDIEFATAYKIKIALASKDDIQNRIKESFPQLETKVPKETIPQVRPWVRWAARLFDYGLFALVFGSVSAFTAPALLAKLANEREVKIWLNMLIMLIWVFIEAFLLSIWGTTPGKWLLKITVRESSGKKLTFSGAFSRSLSVYLRGVGIGFPIATFITFLISYEKLTKEGVTTWDRKGGFIVSHKKIGVLRTIITILFIGLCLLLTVINKIGGKISVNEKLISSVYKGELRSDEDYIKKKMLSDKKEIEEKALSDKIREVAKKEAEKISRWYAKWSELEKNMTESQVLELLGKPKDVDSHDSIGDMKWSYPGFGRVEFEKEDKYGEPIGPYLLKSWKRPNPDMIDYDK